MKILVCGTQGRDLTQEEQHYLEDTLMDNILIEGCCPDSADQKAEEIAKLLGCENKHFPADSGNYIRRNIEMVEACDIVIAFWDGFSYGTAHTVAQAVMNNKPVRIFRGKKK